MRVGTGRERKEALRRRCGVGGELEQRERERARVAGSLYPTHTWHVWHWQVMM